MADLVAWLLPIALPIIASLVAFAIVIRMGNVIRYIPNDSVGIVEKIWSPHEFDDDRIWLGGHAVTCIEGSLKI